MTTFLSARKLALFLALQLAGFGCFAQAVPVGSFDRVVGQVSVQTPGGPSRLANRGDAVAVGDVVATDDASEAGITASDGTRMMLRAKSRLEVTDYRFEPANNNAGAFVTNLLRGGLRMVTGLIGKAQPRNQRVTTNTATIGIRGTDFDARICSRDCGNEASRVTQAAKPNAVQASAKVLSSRGEVAAFDGAGQRRRLVDGGSIYPGDVIETGQGTQAILAFRDESRITVGAASRFRIDNYVFDDKNAGEGRMLTSLLKGTVRALSGLIGRANNKNVSYSTSTATIGIRGTDVFMRCTGACAGEAGAQGDGLTVFKIGRAHV